MWLCKTCNARYPEEASICPLDGGPLVRAEDPLVGRNIGGRYLVGERIGTGGMGTVYRGRHQLVGRDVALKFLAPRYARDARARERFLREARAANRIDHEHIIDITDFGETSDNLVFLVMEYLEGEPLGKVMDGGLLMPPARALTIAKQVAGALARAHELDVIHRDIKPDNIFVLQRSGGDFVKLLDFGLARVLGERRLTATGKVFGTPEYIAPELARGDPAAGAADQYGLGCVLYEMLTGTVPFGGAAQEVLLQHLQDPPDPPTTRRSDLPTAVDKLVLRMLAKDPENRFADAFHLSEELGNLIERLSEGRAKTSGRPLRPVSGLMERPTAATQPWVDAAEEAWAERASELKEALSSQFPDGSAPAELRDGLEALFDLIEEARKTRQRLGATVLEAQQREDEMRASRLRMGRAVDELGRDESRAARNVQNLTIKLREAELRLEEIGQPVAQTWQQLVEQIGRSQVLGRPAAELLRRAGGQAALWMDAEVGCESLRVKLESARREHEDLRFQVSQLKGRLGILTAEGEAELADHRSEAEQLGAELSSLVERLAEVAGPLTQQLTVTATLKSRRTGPPGGVGEARAEERGPGFEPQGA